MKEFKNIEAVKIHDGEIEVKPYLSYANIQAIANEVCKFDSWSEREETIDIMLIHFATNISDKDNREIGHDSFVESGILDEIKSNVKNFNRIYEAIEYTQSTQRALAQILKELPEFLEPLKKVQDKYGSKK